MAVPALLTIERFERAFIPEPNSGCWLWIGGRTGFGYGNFMERIGTAKYRRIDAHRLSWELYRGEIPTSLCVLHRCDVPQCVNPDHLFLGTKGDNAKDAIAKGRRIGDRSRWTHCKNGHPLTADNLVKGARQRRCRVRANAYARQYNKSPKGHAHRNARNLRRRGN